MLHIVIITPGFPVNENDSTCIPFLQVFIKELIKNPLLRLTVITEQHPKNDNYNWNGIDIITLNKKESFISYKLMRYVRLRKALQSLNKTHKIQAIHNFWFTQSAIIASRFALKNKITHLVTFCGQDALASNKVLTKLPFYTGKIFCLSDFHRNKIFNTTGKMVEVIELGIEEINLQKKEEEIDLIFCGWITELKNFDQFVNIVAEVHKKHILKKVVMCGGGVGIGQLKEKINTLGLQNLIEVTGEIPREEVIQLMLKSRILLHTSTFESFGLVLAEGMACGCYVIAKPVGIAYNNPGIITCNSDNEFVESVRYCLEEKILKDFVKNYPISAMVERYLKIYQN